MLSFQLALSLYRNRKQYGTHAKPFQTFTAPIVVAKYIQHLLVCGTLTGNKNLAEAALTTTFDHESFQAVVPSLLVFSKW